MEGVNILERHSAVSNNTSPTGRKLGAVPIIGTASWKIKFVDGIPGEVPADLQGVYTSFTRAQKAINAYLEKFWDKSDLAQLKKSR